MGTESRESLLSLYDPALGNPFAAYCWSDYRMMPERRESLRRHLGRRPDVVAPTSYLDVSCGRGESLVVARECGFVQVAGTEAVPSLVRGPNVVHAVLPRIPFGDDAFHVVSCVDVLEHLLWDDWEPSVRELARVCARRLVLCVSNVEDTFGERVGHDLHVTRLPYEQTDALLRSWLPGWSVEWLSGREGDDGAWWSASRVGKA